MISITIEGSEGWDEEKQEFVKTSKDCTICLEHSLVSISKWESKYHKPFLSEEKKTREELIYYVKCMTITQNVDDSVYNNISFYNLKKVFDYINDPMSATVFYDNNQKKGRIKNKVPTSETLYSYMVGLNIDFKCEKWHLNRLLNLIRICSDNNQPPNKRKMSNRDILERNKRLNAERRKILNTKG